jgi:hypothetical protein
MVISAHRLAVLERFDSSLRNCGRFEVLLSFFLRQDK